MDYKGDFNALLKQKDNIDGMSFTSGSSCRFRRWIDYYGLLNLGFIRYPYTWNNVEQEKPTFMSVRGFSNSAWSLLFPEASIHHLPTLSSDHKPIRLHTYPFRPFLPRPFRFECMWIRDPSVGQVV